MKIKIYYREDFIIVDPFDVQIVQEIRIYLNIKSIQTFMEIKTFKLFNFFLNIK